MSYLSDFQLLGCTSGTEAVVHFLKEQIVHITSELTDISSSNCPSGFGFLFFVFSLLVNSSLCLKVSFSTHFMYSEFWLLDNPYRCKSFTDTLYSIWNSLNTFTVENSAQWVHLKELLLQQIDPQSSMPFQVSKNNLKPQSPHRLTFSFTCDNVKNTTFCTTSTASQLYWIKISATH